MSPSAIRRRSAVLLLAVPVAAAVLGVLLAVAFGGGGGEPGPPPPRPAVVTAGHVRLVAESGWMPTASARPVPGLDGGPAASLRTSGAELTIAELAPANASLLPAALARGNGGGAGQPRVERHGALRMWHYADVLGPSRPVDVYVAPTTAGTATVACARSPGTVDRCARALDGLRLVGASALALGPDAALRERLPAVLAGLNRRRGADRASLAHASTPRAAGTAADRLSRAHLAAFRTLRPLAPAGEDAAGVAPLLARLAFEYRVLAVSLRRHADRAVRRIAREIGADERRLSAALAAARRRQGEPPRAGPPRRERD